MLLAELVFPGWNPVAIQLGPVAIRWYGLAYLAGFLIAGALLDRLVRDGFLPLTKAAVSDLIGWLVLGVLLGGRLGYAIFYDPGMLVRPLELIRVWEGGLSFHGGLAGVLVASVWFATGVVATHRRRPRAGGAGGHRPGAFRELRQRRAVRAGRARLAPVGDAIPDRSPGGGAPARAGPGRTTALARRVPGRAHRNAPFTYGL